MSKIANKPVHVIVHWSESKFFAEKDKIFSFSDFESLAFTASELNSDEYDKTSITVIFSSGDTYNCRLNLGKKHDKGFSDHVKKLIIFSKSPKGKVYYQHFNTDALMFLSQIVLED